MRGVGRGLLSCCGNPTARVTNLDVAQPLPPQTLAAKWGEANLGCVTKSLPRARAAKWGEANLGCVTKPLPRALAAKWGEANLGCVKRANCLACGLLSHRID